MQARKSTARAPEGATHDARRAATPRARPRRKPTRLAHSASERGRAPSDSAPVTLGFAFSCSIARAASSGTTTSSPAHAAARAERVMACGAAAIVVARFRISIIECQI